MPSKVIGRRADFPPGTLKEVTVDEKVYAVANVDGEFHAMDGICSHAGGRLGRGELIGSSVKCPRHGSIFDMKTGKNLKGPKLPFAKAGDLRSYKVRIEGEDIILDL